MCKNGSEPNSIHNGDRGRNVDKTYIKNQHMIMHRVDVETVNLHCTEMVWGTQHRHQPLQWCSQAWSTWNKVINTGSLYFLAKTVAEPFGWA